VKKTGTAAGKELLAADEESLVMKIKKPPLDRAAVIAVRSGILGGKKWVFETKRRGWWLRLEIRIAVGGGRSGEGGGWVCSALF
jgi:hypothetical protein